MPAAEDCAYFWYSVLCSMKGGWKRGTFVK